MSNKLTDKILHTIKEEKIEPTPRWHFLLRNYSVWSVGIFSVLIGSLSVAAIIFAYANTELGVSQTGGSSSARLVIQTMPYVWLLSLVVLLVVGELAIRNTKRGYRYTIVQIFSFSVASSVLLGSGLFAVGFGHAVDSALAKHVPSYRPIFERKLERLVVPQSGKLAGEILLVTTTEAYDFSLIDFSGREWRIVQDSSVPEDLMLVPQMEVSLRGYVVDEDTFTMCDGVKFTLAGKHPLFNLDRGSVKPSIMRRIREQKAAEETSLATVEIKDSGMRITECDGLHSGIRR